MHMMHLLFRIRLTLLIMQMQWNVYRSVSVSEGVTSWGLHVGVLRVIQNGCGSQEKLLPLLCQQLPRPILLLPHWQRLFDGTKKVNGISVRTVLHGWCGLCGIGPCSPALFLWAVTGQWSGSGKSCRSSHSDSHNFECFCWGKKELSYCEERLKDQLAFISLWLWHCHCCRQISYFSSEP